MPVETAADRNVFLSAAEFGVAATYTPVGQSARMINGIFDAAWQDLNVGLELGVNGVSPRILVAEADLVSGGRRGDTFTINGKTYITKDPQPDGTGMVNCLLREA